MCLAPPRIALCISALAKGGSIFTDSSEKNEFSVAIRASSQKSITFEGIRGHNPCVSMNATNQNPFLVRIVPTYLKSAELLKPSYSGNRENDAANRFLQAMMIYFERKETYMGKQAEQKAIVASLCLTEKARELWNPA